LDGDRLSLRADTDAAGEVEVFAPARHLVVDGRYVATRRTPSGSLLGSLPGPRAVTLPELTDWRYRAEPPATGDDGWTVADKTTTASPTKPKTLPVLYADEYGYHYGNVWYRGDFVADGTEKTVSLNAITGKGGSYLVWLNGRYLGSAAGGTQADSDAPVNPDPGRGDFAVPAGTLVKGQPARLSVLVTNMGHNDDWTADDTRFKQPRGLFGASVGDAKIAWKIRGAVADAERGPLNAGGLYGERQGWHLPGGPAWRDRPPSTVEPGVAWYRTGFRLDTPKDQDVSVALRFGERAGKYRVFVFLNGWNMGQYVSGGPQRDFVLPNGILKSSNTLTLAVVSADGGAGSPVPVSLVALGNHWTGGLR
jgi:hypothetical protein